MRFSQRLSVVGLRSLATLIALVLFAGVIHAYTIVRRDGKRVQIPDQFVVTPTTLTYEVSAGFQVTLQLSTIDVVATERVNGERPGSLLGRVASLQVNTDPTPAVSTTGGRARRSITNRELAPYARTRVHSAVAYEARRKELGLPTVEESRRRQEAESELIRQEFEERRGQEAESETHWRSRGSDLRTEVAAVDAEISYVRARLDEVSSYANNSTSIVTDMYPLGYGGFGNYDRRNRGRGYSRFPQQPVFVGPGMNGRNRGYRNRNYRNGYPGAWGPFGNGSGPLNSGVHIGIGLGGYGTGYGNPGLGLPYPNLGGFNSNQNYDVSQERSALIMRLDELVGRRAALSARSRELEAEARRAGAYPGWLRQ